MSQRMEGTIALDGLIEGPVPDSPGAEQTLRGWVDFARSTGLSFALEIDGGSFNLLAENRPIPVARLGASATETISQAVREFLKIFTPAQRAKVLSTLRSVEFGKGEEVQTLYAIAPDGTVATRQRLVDAHTTAPTPPLTTGQKARLGGLGVLMALVVVLASALFVDYRGLVRSLRDRFMPPSADEVAVDAGGFANYFTVEKKQVGKGGDALIVTLQRSAGFPLQDADYARLATSIPSSMPTSGSLALDGIARGYVRCELFDADGGFIGFTMVRIAELRAKPTTELVVPLPRERRVTKVVITY